MTVGGTVLSGNRIAWRYGVFGCRGVSGSTRLFLPIKRPLGRHRVPVTSTTLCFSRSAPTDSDHTRMASFNIHGTGSSYPQVTGTSQLPFVTYRFRCASWCFFEVFNRVPHHDFREPLLALPSTHPTLISQFMASKRQPINNINFTSDGNLLIVFYRILWGHSRLPSWTCSSCIKGRLTAEPWHVFNLRRRRTSAV
jgi:hypothetical protein